MSARDVFGIVGTTQAGNFHVERVVAEGGFGVVYRAQHGAFRAPVALKCLKIPEQMTKQQRAVFLEKFREEAELMFRLSAAITEVVRPLHVDVLALPDGRFVPFLALEWLEGESLDGIIVRRREQGQAPLGLHKVVKLLRPGASALSRAHRFPGPQGAICIIHRDLKPENIIVANIGGTESLKILDFGIAKAKRAASQAVGRITGRTLEEDESASFTPAYGAPEQWSPKTYGETGPWTDVWGLALCMVEALCGTPPIDGDTYVMRRICLDEKKRPTPRALGADVPAEIDKVFERALAVDPRKRFKDIESFWSALEIAMGLEPSLRTKDARREPDGATTAEVGPEPGPAGAGARLARIDLLKVPSVVNMPAVKVAVVAPKPLEIKGAVPRDDREEDLARPSKRGEAAVGLARDPAPPSSGRGHEGARAKPPDEDWASLGLGDGPPSAPARRHAVGLEMPLPSRDSDPQLEARIQPSSRALSGEFELNLHEDGLPPPAVLGAAPPSAEPTAPPSSPRPRAVAESYAGVAPRPPERRPLSGEFELTLPSSESTSADAPARPPERRSISGELELHLPSSATAPSPRPSENVADVGIDIHVSSQRAPRLDPPPPAYAPPPRFAVAARPQLSLGERLRAPLGALLGSLAVALIAFVYQRSTGNPLELGPVRLTWIAAPLALFGVGFLLWRLIGAHPDE